MKILAIDLGKFKSVACLYVVESAEATFETIITQTAEVEDLLARSRPDRVVFEACTAAGWVWDLCQRLKLPAQVANPCGEAWKWKHIKRKTDRDDALKLARLSALGQLPETKLPAPETRQRRALLKFRQQLVGQRVRMQNHIRALLLGQGILSARGHRAWTEAGLEDLDDMARPLTDCGPHDLWRGQLHVALAHLRQLWERIDEVEQKLDALGKADPRVQLLETIPGMGPRTAEVVVAFLDDPHRFANGRQVSAYAGLVPRQYQSGETDRRGHITRRGPGLLRKMLVEDAWLMLRYNPWAQRVVQRISGGQKTRRKQALVALARKLLVRCWAMLRDGTKWKDGPSLAEAAAAAGVEFHAVAAAPQ
jgi:transposase